ncbi:MAG: histidine kinase [Burkholderiales bacterium]
MPPAPPAPARHGWHPLEIFPVFSRVPPSVGRNFVYTFLFNTLLAAVFTALAGLFVARIDFAAQFLACFVFAQCIGYAIWILIAVASRGVPDDLRRLPAVRWALYVGLPVVGSFAGFWLASTLLAMPEARAEMFTWQGTLSILAISAVVVGILLGILVPRERAARAQAVAARDEARATAAEREVAVARLQLLEAQVEPHFLFNTLAHVVSLVDREPAQAKRMLHRLIDLLRATAVSGDRETTLAGQLDLLRAYLDLIAMRMGERLAWSVTAPADVQGLAVPPMLLQPVVENAIKHGLEPKVEGGRVDVVARRDAGRLVLEVTDTGVGVAAARGPASTGIGIANLKARLAALYGAEASVVLADHVPCGTRVTLVLPVKEAA